MVGSTLNGLAEEIKKSMAKGLPEVLIPTTPSPAYHKLKLGKVKKTRRRRYNG